MHIVSVTKQSLFTLPKRVLRIVIARGIVRDHCGWQYPRKKWNFK